MSKRGNRFRASITVAACKTTYLGTYDTAKGAALAFDRAVVQHKRPRSLLNYPDGLPIDDENYDEIMNPTKKRRLRSTNTTGYNGVRKDRQRFQARVQIDLKQKILVAMLHPKKQQSPLTVPLSNTDFHPPN